MSKYTDEKQNDFQAMLKAISAHKDFGKRNPVDIGIECGYDECDMLEMIEMLRANQDKKEDEGTKSKEDLYYFLVNKDSKDYIISVNINTWKAKKIKAVEDAYHDFDIKGSLFARTGFGRKTLVLENLETGECKKFLSDEDIEKIMILDNEVFIGMRNNLIIWDGKQIVAQKEHQGVPYYKLWIRVGNRIYMVDNYSIDSFDIELKEECRKYKIKYPAVDHAYKSPQIYEVGNDNGKIFGFGSYESFMGLFTLQTYIRNFPMKLEPEEGKKFYFERLHHCSESGLVQDYMSKNYGLLGQEIYSRKKMETTDEWVDTVCDFARDIFNKQVIVDYENDIFIGINKNNDIIKIDLKNEREVTVIPITLTDEEN